MKVYAFDVDHTLSVSNGPVKLQDLYALYGDGHILGLCGNYAVFTRTYPDTWSGLFSFLGPMGMTKKDFLLQLKTYIPCEEVVMVGNDEPGLSLDGEAAIEAGVRFIKEIDFANGIR